MFCSKCGSEVSDGATFCGTCGAEMLGASTMPMAAAGADQTSVMPTMAGAYPQGAPDGLYGAGGQDWQPQEEPPKKSKKGKVIAIIIAVLVLMGLGAGVAWYFTNQFYQDKLAAEQSASAAVSAQADQVSVEASEPSAASGGEEDGFNSSFANGGLLVSDSDDASLADGADSASSSGGPSDTVDAAGDADSYVGTWTGEMTSTSTRAKYNCYGATGNPLVLTITGNETTGQITADAKMLLHGHNINELTSDVDKHDADKMIELKNLVGTFKDGNFTFKRELDADYPGSTVEIRVSTGEKNGERVLICEVERDSDSMMDRVTDVYELKKKKA